MDFVTSGIGASLWATALLALLLFLSARLGAFFMAVTGTASARLTRLESFLFSTGLGLIVLSLSVFGLGVSGCLTRNAVLVLLLTAALAPMIKRGPSIFSPVRPGGGAEGWERFLWFWLFAVLAVSWIQALAPPIGNDALVYHLYHPKLFIQQHRMFQVPFARESLWPYQTEMLFTLGLLLQGTTLATLFHWTYFGLTASAVYALTLRFYGRREALLAAVMFALCPMAFAQSGQAYVDLSFAFYVFLPVYAFLLRHEIGENRAALLSGLTAAGALSTKYLALSSMFVLFLLWIVRSRGRFKTTLTFCVAAAVLSGGWYLRSWVLTGNPVYPFFPGIFGAGSNFDVAEGIGFGKGALNFLTLGWDMVMHPRAFSGEVIGPAYLLFVPYLLLLSRKGRAHSWEMASYALLHTFLLFKQSQTARFYISVVPFLSVGAAVAFVSLKERGKALKVAAWTVLIGLMVLHSAMYVYRTRNLRGVVLGRQSATEYLSEHERSFKGYLYFKDHVKPSASILNAAESRYFYNENPGMVMDSAFLKEDLERKGTSIARFLEEKDFDYIWLQDDAEILEFVQKHGYKPVYAYDFTEKPASWHLTIYASSKNREAMAHS